MVKNRGGENGMIVPGGENGISPFCWANFTKNDQIYPLAHAFKHAGYSARHACNST